MAKQKVPQKYLSGLKQSTADRRKAEIRKRLSGKSKDKYAPLPGDKKSETRPSRYTLSASKLRMEIREATSKMESGSQQDRFIRAVSKVTEIPRSIISEVYKKGLAAWAIGHRPGATPAQWARARVYSFLQRGNTVTKGPDLQLYQEAKKALKEKGKGLSLR